MTGKKHKKKMKSLKSLAKKSKGPVTAQSLLASVAVKNVVGKDKKTTNNIFSLMKKSHDSVESTKEEKNDGVGNEHDEQQQQQHRHHGTKKKGHHKKHHKKKKHSSMKMMSAFSIGNKKSHKNPFGKSSNNNNSSTSGGLNAFGHVKKKSAMFLQAKAVNTDRFAHFEQVKRKKAKGKRPDDIPGGRLKDLGYPEELVDAWTSASRGNLKEVKRFVDRGNNINMLPGCYPNGTLLHQAAQRGHIEVVKYLVGQKADVNALDDVRNTPLHRAARFGKTDIVRYLLSKKANPEPLNEMERTPWELAKLNWNEEAAALLPIGDLTNIAARLKYEERIQMVLEEKSVVMTTSGGEEGR